MVIIGARLASVIGLIEVGVSFWIELPYLLVVRFRKLALLYLSKIQIQNHNVSQKMSSTSLWIPCSCDKGSSSSSLIITSALALYLRYFSSGWTPTRNLRSNTCLQKISEFPLKKHMPSQFCLLSFIFRVTAAISVIQHQDQLLCTITSIVSLFSFWSDLSLER
jgi:hypothetical protein